MNSRLFCFRPHPTPVSHHHLHRYCPCPCHNHNTQQLLEAPRDAPRTPGQGRLKAPRAASLRAPGTVLTLLGPMPGAAVGATLVARGTWDNHERHGWQIR